MSEPTGFIKTEDGLGVVDTAAIREKERRDALAATPPSQRVPEDVTGTNPAGIDAADNELVSDGGPTAFVMKSLSDEGSATDEPPASEPDTPPADSPVEEQAEEPSSEQEATTE